MGNYLPIACLNIIRKILTGICAANIYTTIYTFLTQEEILPRKRKGCRKSSQGTKDHLAIGKTFLRHCEKHHTNIFVARIDFKKAYDMVPHSWIFECLKMFGVVNKITNFPIHYMKEWKTKLYSSNVFLVGINIKKISYKMTHSLRYYF